MRYSLWGRDKLLGYTDLDIPHVQDHVRLGFIEPTADGLRLLPDATGVPSAAHALSQRRKNEPEAGFRSLTEYADFQSACDRREALAVELRDETGAVFPCEWIAIHDLQEHSSSSAPFACGVFDDVTIDDELEQLDPEVLEAIEHDAELLEEFNDEDDYASEWRPPDERWETMRFYLMAYLGNESALR